jgi:hypothetical protein
MSVCFLRNNHRVAGSYRVLLGHNHFHAICAFVDGVEGNLIPMLQVKQPYDTELMAEEFESAVWTISDSKPASEIIECHQLHYGKNFLLVIGDPLKAVYQMNLLVQTAKEEDMLRKFFP